MQNKNNLLTIFNFSLSFHDSTKPILFRFILLLLSFHDRSRSPQFGHLHGFFTARGPKWRQFCDAAKSKLACFRTAFVRRSPTMKPVTRERASIVTGIINGPSLFSHSRVTTTVSRVASQFCRKNNIQPPPLPSFPRLSNYLFSHRHLSPSLHTPGLTLSPFPLLHTHIRMHKPSSSTASLVHPFVLPLFSTIPLSLSFSLFILRSLGSISLSLAPVLEKERNRDVGEERDT